MRRISWAGTSRAHPPSSTPPSSASTPATEISAGSIRPTRAIATSTFFESFGTGRLLNVYEFMLFSGQTYYFGLLRQSGVGDLRFEVFPGTAGSTWFRGAGVPSNAVIPEYDNLTFVAPATGWYPVVVFRDAGDGGAALLDYRFQWSTAPIVGVDPAPEASAHVLSFDPIVPNPGRGSIQFGFTLPAPGPARLELYDAAGRRVRLLRDGDHPAGRTTLRWDGRDDSGAPTAAGLYWVRFEAAGRTLARKLVRIP